MENLMIGVLCALAGGYFGYSLTVKQANDRTKLQKQALWKEFSLIQEMFSKCVEKLMGEYEKPLKNAYVGVPKFDMTIIDSLSCELSASTELLNYDQRELIMGLKSTFKNLQKHETIRDGYIQTWLKNENKSGTYSSIGFYTAVLLRDVLQVIYYSYKISEYKDNFTYDQYGLLEHAKVTCELCKIDFDASFWERIEQRLSSD